MVAYHPLTSKLFIFSLLSSYFLSSAIAAPTLLQWKVSSNFVDNVRRPAPWDSNGFADDPKHINTIFYNSVQVSEESLWSKDNHFSYIFKDKCWWVIQGQANIFVWQIQQSSVQREIWQLLSLCKYASVASTHTNNMWRKVKV